MYATTRRTPRGQLGWLPAVIGAATQIGGALLNKDDGKIDVGDYYPAVANLRVLCKGPFDVATVARGLRASPPLMAEADAILRQDPAWVEGKYGVPSLGRMTPEQKAAAVVNWAHGGRTCAYTSGAAAQSVRLAQQATALSAPATYGGAPPASSGPDTVGTAPTYGTWPGTTLPMLTPPGTVPLTSAARPADRFPVGFAVAAGVGVLLLTALIDRDGKVPRV